MLDVTLITTAAFFAGVLNSIAGGGSFLTLPALVYGTLVAAVNLAVGTLAVTLVVALAVTLVVSPRT